MVEVVVKVVDRIGEAKERGVGFNDTKECTRRSARE